MASQAEMVAPIKIEWPPSTVTNTREIPVNGRRTYQMFLSRFETAEKREANRYSAFDDLLSETAPQNICLIHQAITGDSKFVWCVTSHPDKQRVMTPFGEMWLLTWKSIVRIEPTLVYMAVLDMTGEDLEIDYDFESCGAPNSPALEQKTRRGAVQNAAKSPKDRKCRSRLRRTRSPSGDFTSFISFFRQDHILPGVVSGSIIILVWCLCSYAICGQQLPVGPSEAKLPDSAVGCPTHEKSGFINVDLDLHEIGGVEVINNPYVTALLNMCSDGDEHGCRLVGLNGLLPPPPPSTVPLNLQNCVFDSLLHSTNMYLAEKALYLCEVDLVRAGTPPPNNVPPGITSCRLNSLVSPLGNGVVEKAIYLCERDLYGIQK